MKTTIAPRIMVLVTWYQRRLPQWPRLSSSLQCTRDLPARESSTRTPNFPPRRQRETIRISSRQAAPDRSRNLANKKTSWKGCACWPNIWLWTRQLINLRPEGPVWHRMKPQATGIGSGSTTLRGRIRRVQFPYLVVSGKDLISYHLHPPDYNNLKRGTIHKRLKDWPL